MAANDRRLGLAFAARIMAFRIRLCLILIEVTIKDERNLNPL
jgi:hypothetical protein